jgi:hypothetical protein
MKNMETTFFLCNYSPSLLLLIKIAECSATEVSGSNGAELIKNINAECVFKRIPHFIGSVA